MSKIQIFKGENTQSNKIISRKSDLFFFFDEDTFLALEWEIYPLIVKVCRIEKYLLSFIFKSCENYRWVLTREDTFIIDELNAVLKVSI